MNYYLRSPGDHMCRTQLSMIEEGALTRLLDWSALNDCHVPHDRRHAIARASSPIERAAVDLVLLEFFALRDGAWSNQTFLSTPRKDCSYRKFRSLVIGRDGSFCAYCGTADEPLELDHVFPRSRGGSNLPDNLTPACRTCNASKGARTVDEWRGS